LTAGAGRGDPPGTAAVLASAVSDSGGGPAVRRLDDLHNSVFRLPVEQLGGTMRIGKYHGWITDAAIDDLMRNRAPSELSGALEDLKN
jgi:hypothetical protein